MHLIHTKNIHTHSRKASNKVKWNKHSAAPLNRKSRCMETWLLFQKYIKTSLPMDKHCLCCNFNVKRTNIHTFEWGRLENSKKKIIIIIYLKTGGNAKEFTFSYCNLNTFCSQCNESKWETKRKKQWFQVAITPMSKTKRHR